jgi:hypothetical protein
VESDKNEVIPATVESRPTTCVSDTGATVSELVQQMPAQTGQQLMAAAY